MAYIESQDKMSGCNNNKDMHLTFTCTIIKSNTLFALMSRAVTVLYLVLCPGESCCPSTAKDNVLPDSHISSNCSS